MLHTKFNAMSLVEQLSSPSGDLGVQAPSTLGCHLFNGRLPKSPRRVIKAQGKHVGCSAIFAWKWQSLQLTFYWPELVTQPDPDAWGLGNVITGWAIYGTMEKSMSHWWPTGCLPCLFCFSYAFHFKEWFASTKWNNEVIWVHLLNKNINNSTF